MSRKYKGFRLVAHVAILVLAALLSANPVLADDPLQVIVESSQSGPLSGLKVYAFTESGSYTGKNFTTDESGTALFVLEDFEDVVYQFRVDYLGQQFWSDLVDIPEDSSVSVVIEEETVRVTVSDAVDPIIGIRVYLFSAAGAYLGVYGNTDASGDVFFDVPLDITLKLRADTLGYQFWSEDIQVYIGIQVNFVIPHQEVEISVEGAFQGASEPIERIPVYLFTPSGSYLGLNQSTDVNGQVLFHLPEMPYKVRADYLGQRFWSDEFTWQDTTVSVLMADAQITVTGNGQRLEGVRVYVFSATDSYLGLFDTTDSDGQVLFRLPAGKYKFRADYQGSQYWSGEEALAADQMNPVSISTGGGTFVFTVLKSASDPITGIKCYVFSDSGTYLGMSGTTNTSGEVSFDLADGSYKIRTDYLGYQFWSNILEIPNTLSDALLIAHAAVSINVEGMYLGTREPLEGIKVYLFTPSGSYLSQYQVTDENGQVTFNLPEQVYKVRADYLGQQFWSGEFTWQDTTVEVPMADADITVTSSDSELEGVKVYVFSVSGSYLGISGTTDSVGKVAFRLPAGTYKFRADYKGSQYWSGEETLQADQVNSVSIFTGGGAFTFTVLRGESDPLVGVKCYVFSEGGAYLGIHSTTDENGQVVFDLSEGRYKFRTDYLGYQFWSDIYDVPNTLSDVFTIPHQEVTITVAGIYGTSEPIEGVKVYLFTPSGSYLGQYQLTNVNGQVILYLPNQPYKVRVDYLGQQFWSDDFQFQDTTVIINEGLADVHVHRAGVDIEGVRVYLFSEGGSYLGQYETTDVAGEVEFRLPDRSYKFRVDEGGSQYWSPVIEITADAINSIEIELSPTTIFIGADPETIPPGGTATLTWNSTNAYACEIEPGIGSVEINGSIDVSPAETTEYTIIATGPGGTAKDTVQVVVTAEVTIPGDVDLGLAIDEQEGGGGLVGETVRILNGNTVEYRSDLAFPSPNRLGLSFEATYNSRSTISGALGFGWTHTYDVSLDPDFDISGGSYIKILGPTGRAFYFQEETVGFYKGVFHERSFVKAEAEGYVWYRLNGTRYGFTASGKIICIEDEKANRLSVAYDAQDRVATVFDTANGSVFTFGYNANGLLESITGPVTTAVSGGVWVTYGYDAGQNLTSVTYADGSGFTYGYTDPNDVHNLTEKRNKANHQLNTWGYDDQDRCVSNFSVQGRGVSIDYVSESQVAVTDAYGTVRTYTFGDVGDRKRLTALQGNAVAPYTSSNEIRWAYDDSMSLIEVEYANGTINHYQDYDERGNPGTVKLAAGSPEERTIIFTYHPDMNIPLTRTEASVLQAGGNKVTIWDYDDDYDNVPNEDPTAILSRIVEQGYTRDVSGAAVAYEYVTSITYNGRGQVLSVDGPRPGSDDTTTFTYNATSGDLLTITRALIGATTFSNYDAAGQIGRMKDINGQSKSFSYDGRGRVTTITHEADSSTMTFVYNTAGKVQSRTDEDGVTRTFDCDSTYGRLNRITDIDGNYVNYDYDNQGNRIEMSKYDKWSQRTYWRRYGYQQPDIPGKLWKEINPDGTFTEYGYYPFGNVSSVKDPLGHTTTYGYDPLNRLETVTQPGSVVTGYEYDSHGNLTNVNDAEGHVTTYQYDDMGRLVSTTSPDTGTVTYIYDATGSLVSKTDANGITVEYDHDLLNRLTLIDFPDDQDIIYTYDERTNGKGHTTGMTDTSGSTIFDYDNRGRLFEKASTISGHSFTLTYSYSLANRLTSVIYPTGRNATYTRNSTGMIEEISTLFESITTILMNNFSYLPFGLAASMDTGTGSAVMNVFDELYRMTVANPGGQTERFYTYNANGNITNIDVTNNQNKNQAFTYDPLKRLLTASGIYGSIGYTYDKVGNRLIRTVNDDTETCSYISGTNKLQEITGSNPATFAYDANGSTTGIGGITLIYNQNNRLIRAEEDSNVLGEYTYNGLGQRVMKQAGGVTILFFYDFSGNLVGESLSDGTVTSEYIYMGESRLARVDSINNVIYFDCNDHLGTPQVITDENGVGVWKATYKPFGEAQVDSSLNMVNNFRLPGQYFDEETGLQYNYFRDYHPGIGRYVEPDPIGLEGGINLYAYCFNDPVNLVDPSGQFGVPGIVIGAASGALAGFGAGMQSGKLWAGIVGGTAGGIIGGAIGFAFPPASSVVGGMIGGAVAGASGGAVGGMVGKRLSDPDASNKEMFIATAKGAGIGLLTGGTAGGLGTAALGVGATALTADLAGTMAATPIAMGLGMIEFDSGLDTEDYLASTIPDSLKYALNIYTSSDEIDPGGAITLYVDSGGLACPPYQWSVSGTGFSLDKSQTYNDLETVTLTAPYSFGTCGVNYDVLATVTVIDQCGGTDEIKIKNTGGSWVFLGTKLSTCSSNCSPCDGGSTARSFTSGNKRWWFSLACYIYGAYSWGPCKTGTCVDPPCTPYGEGCFEADFCDGINCEERAGSYSYYEWGCP